LISPPGRPALTSTLTTKPPFRRLGNRLVGILHGCLKTGTPYDEVNAWDHPPSKPPP
jgi:hypothetical protein